MSVYTTAQLLAVNEKKFKFDPLFLRIFSAKPIPSVQKVYLSQILARSIWRFTSRRLSPAK